MGDGGYLIVVQLLFFVPHCGAMFFFFWYLIAAMVMITLLMLYTLYSVVCGLYCYCFLLFLKFLIAAWLV